MIQEPSTLNNKKWGLDVLAIVLAALLSIAVCAAVWNYCPEVFVKILAGVKLLTDGFIIIRFAKKLRNSDL